MELINHTPYVVSYSTGLLTTGQYCVLVVAKATFMIPTHSPEGLELAEEQVRLYETDKFQGEPGYSSPLFENDFATNKPLCDVLISGSACSVGNQPVRELKVCAEVGEMSKSFIVTGKRCWEKQGRQYRASEPEPFDQQALNWEIAYGGTLNDPDDDARVLGASGTNPVGIGFTLSDEKSIDFDQQTIAQTESINNPIIDPQATYEPQALSGVGRNWQPRLQYAGTYDEQWIQQRKPFLPDDFDERYYQCAPEDQQIPHLQGGESVYLKHLSPRGDLNFTIPSLHLPIAATFKDGRHTQPDMLVDTLHISTQSHLLTMVARTQIPFIHSITEVSTVTVGIAPVIQDESPTDLEEERDD